MYTQCTNCQAIFSVSMREVTVSKGYLRCGECMQVFDSSKSLSTTMQKPYVDVDLQNKVKLEKLSEESLQTISALDDWQNSPAHEPEDPINLKQKLSKAKKVKASNPKSIEQTKKNKPAFTTKGVEKKQTKSKSKNKKTLKWPAIAAGALSLLLVTQFALNYKTLFSDSPKYQPEKIQMLNHNVFAHPIDQGVLLISASIENIADFDQPFPVLEVRLTNSKSELVALRRFTPEEYLDNFSTNKLLAKNQATSIKLKIQDPGNQATRFQFDFL